MGLRINTNVQSMAAQRSLNVNGASQKANLEHLASGSRINKAADDAAGLAISEKMRGHMRSLQQDMRNANDGISMIQTAEGAMNEMGNILIRFRELSIQGASDTISDTERGFIDKEVQQLSQEVGRITNSTEYNGTKLLNGEAGELEVQIGVHNNPEEDRFIFDAAATNVTADALGIEGISIESKEDAQGNLEKVDEAMKTLTSNRANLGALQNRLTSSINNMQIYNENLAAAKSRIADVDIASETADLTKNNILTSANVTVLSQANSNPMMALKLVG